MEDNFIYRLIYEDNRIVVVSKREGILVSRARGSLSNVKTLTDYLREIYKDIYIVHRIDMETSGIIVFARDRQTHKKLSILFEKREVKKKYLAVIWGNINKELIINKPIHQFSSGRCGISDCGKASITYIKPLKNFSGFTLVEAIPYTGRRHQIRVHLYSIGHSIVGDPLYGDLEKQRIYKRMFLHSFYLSFVLDSSNYSFDDSDNFLSTVHETFFI